MQDMMAQVQNRGMMKCIYVIDYSARVQVQIVRNNQSARKKRKASQEGYGGRYNTTTFWF